MAGGVSERIRVVRVIARLNVGGPAIHATLLTERLDPARFESLLVTGTEEPGEGNYLALRGAGLERLHVIAALGREIRYRQDLTTLVTLTRLLRRVRPHIVHSHTAKGGTLGRLAARLAGVPIVLHTYHGHVFRGYFSPSRTRLFLAIERWLARRTDRLLTVSEAVRDDLLALGIGTPRQHMVVPLGLDLERFVECGRHRGALRAELGLPRDAPLVAIVARLVPIKAHEVFLQAAARVAHLVGDSRFLVIGDGERGPELRALAAGLGLGERVRFLGWRADIDRIYADVDVVALTSRNEGSPVSLIEAMAAARPVVATRVGGVPGLVEDGVSGCLVEPGDVEGVAAAIRDLLGDPERRRTLGMAGRKRVVPSLAATRLIADVERLYTDLVAEKLGTTRGDRRGGAGP
jgi:glycosyltransferase involved in cell wall biosynthesis